ncbi:MAG TPA: tetratricopeptide repeat protein [Fimbriimonadaceae bacterium]|nr:tetratricopeptide repeat protein [Fimbriimonadaceae bacterium]
MAAVFVGREKEIAQFEDWVLSEVERRVALVIGQPGIGKTELLKQFEETCRARTSGKWIVVFATVNANESSGAFLERLLEEAYQLCERAYVRRGPNDQAKLKGLLEAIPAVGKLLASYAREDRRPAWLRFRDFLRLLTEHLAATDRLVFIVDPKHELQAGHETDWLALSEDLPERVRVVFAQRPADVIARHPESRTRFQCVPSKGHLGDLDEGDVRLLYEREYAGRLGVAAGSWPERTRCSLPTSAFRRYKGYPAAHAAVIKLLQRQVPFDPLSEIVTWPEDVAGLLDALFGDLARQGDEDRIRAALVLPIFSVPTPPGYWAESLGKTTEWLAAALADPKFRLFFSEEGEGYTLFHSLFAERLEKHLAESDSTRNALAESAWAALKISFEVTGYDGDVPSQFALRAGVPVAMRSGDEQRLLQTANLFTKVKSQIGMYDSLVGDLTAIVEHSADREDIVAQCSGNLGILFQMRGDLNEAEAMFRKALEISEKFGRPDTVASCYDHLGVVLKTRGDLGGAEELHRIALELNERLGQPDGMANAYANLGNVLQDRGDLAGAEAAQRSALAINKKLNRLSAMATNYSNLGITFKARGDLGQAESMYRKALAIEEELGHAEGIASDYGNLGNVLLDGGDLAGAEEMHRRALEIFERLELPLKTANQYGNLANLFKARGDLDEAEVMYRKSIEINEEIGRPEGVAAGHVNLAHIFLTRGDLSEAEALCRKSLEVCDRHGLRPGAARAQENLGIVLRRRGDSAGARASWLKALDLLEQMGLADQARRVDKRINEIVDA